MRSALVSPSADWTALSLILSSAEVASSRMRIGGCLSKMRNGQALSLTAGEVLTALRHLGIVPFRHHHYFIMDVGQFRREANVVARNVLIAVGNVFGNRSGDDERLLADIADNPADILARYSVPTAFRPETRSRRKGGISRNSTLIQVDLPEPGRPATPIVSP